MKKQKIVALLPIKKNSQRLNGKNFREFYGRPLFRWILDTLLSINEIDYIVINTDAKELLQNKGLPNSDRIIIRERKKDLCGDEVSMNLIINDDINYIDADIYIMTHVTNPLLGNETIKNAILLFVKNSENYDSLFTVNRIQSRVYDDKGFAINHNPKELIQTQDLSPCFVENSNLYIFTKNSFTETKSRIGSKPYLLETSQFESIDIDNQIDWDNAVLGAYFIQSNMKK